MVIEVSNDNGGHNRIFFGLKPNGDYLFGEDENGIHQFTMPASDKREYSENFCATIEEDGACNEYIISVSNLELKAELYDFNHNSVHEMFSKDLIKEEIISIKHSSANFLINGFYLVVFQSWVKIDENEGDYSFRTNILEFNTKDLDNGINMGLISQVDYILKNERSSSTSPFSLERMVDSDNFLAYPFYDRTFFKLVHLKDDIGVAVFFSFPYYVDYNISLAFPSFLVRKMVGRNLLQYMDPSYNDSIIIDFHGKLFNYDCLLSDLIRVSDFKVSFIFYIILIEIYSPKEYFLKLYELDLYGLYNIKVYEDIREHLFENLIALGFNYCNTSRCAGDPSNTHYSAFLIFGYPNSTDGYLNINQYLEENKGATFNNITFDLKKYVKIENNLFGYTYSSIDIVNLIGCENIILYSTNGNEINVNYQLKEVEEIKIKFRNRMKAFNCSIFFRYVLIDPIYSEDKKYYIDEISSPDFINYKDVYNNKRMKYSGKISHYNIWFDYIEPTYPINTIPTTIIDKIETNPVTEKIEEKIEKTTQNIKEKEETEKIEKTFVRENNKCSNEEVLDNKCGDGIIEVDQVIELFNQFSTNIMTFNYFGDTKVIETPNIILQIILLNAQDFGPNSTVSFVNIGECEKILKSVYGIPENYSLIMVKSDSKMEDNKATNVIFDLYHPINKTKLNLSYCNEVDIKIDIPTNLENNTIDLYDSLLESGYNLFDSQDSFYNDVCTVYTSTNGTDMTLSDRQNIIYSKSGNISLCQDGCIFSSYNKTFKTVQCDCNVQSTSSETSSLKLDKDELKNSFINTILNSNFIILKCIKMAFNFKNILTNQGRIAMSIIVFFFFVIIIIFFINDKNTINKYFKLILEDKIKRERIETSKGNNIYKNKIDSFISEKQNENKNNDLNSNIKDNITIINIGKKKS